MGRLFTAMLAVLAFVALASTPATAARPGGLVVRTGSGLVSGLAKDGERQFLGIPYAAPPTGQRRWQPPQRPQSWNGVRDARSYGDSCVQDSSWDPGYDEPILTEDCLSANVYVPDSARPGLPVLVWIHGGGFVNGAGRDVVPTTMVTKRDTVVVTVNYRLGALGLLRIPALGLDGNVGLLDQQYALRWVQRNIGAFGGNPARVTIAGESAGGASVCDHLASPAAAGLFSAAIIQSGAYDGCGVTTDAAARQAAGKFLQDLGCTVNLDCLEAKTPAEIIAAQADVDWGPVVGGPALLVAPMAAFASGHYNRVPVVNGSNLNEGTLFIFGNFDYQGKTLSAAEYPAVVRAEFKAAGDQVLAAYPLSAYTVPALAMSAAVTDSYFACPAYALDSALSSRGPVFTYEFADQTAPRIEGLRGLPSSFPLGAHHAVELQYLFRHFGHPSPFDRAQRKLSDQMISYWSTFAAFRLPLAPGQPPMPLFAPLPTGGPTLSLETGGSHLTTDFARFHKCAFWSGVDA
jgi:para-nitrobenzyl esterase